MCLHAIQEKVENWEFGYKVFGKLDGSLLRNFQGLDLTRPEGTWIKEIDYRTHRTECRILGGKSTYPTGWHVFKTRKAANNWKGDRSVVRKVKCRKPVATGTQTFTRTRRTKVKVGVFKEIFIILPEKGDK